MLVCCILTEHWFDCSSYVSSPRPHLILVEVSSHDIAPSLERSHFALTWVLKSYQSCQAAPKLGYANKLVVLFRCIYSDVLRHVTQHSDVNYVCLDSTCSIRITNVSRNASQFHVPCTNEWQHGSHVVVLEPDINERLWITT